MKDHLKIAKAGWSHKSKIYPALVEANFEYKFEVVGKFDTELEALLKEIMCIRKAGLENTLNWSPGGEGCTITVKIREFKNGNIQFKVVPRYKSKKRTKRTKRRRSRHG